MATQILLPVEGTFKTRTTLKTITNMANLDTTRIITMIMTAMEKVMDMIIMEVMAPKKPNVIAIVKKRRATDIITPMAIRNLPNANATVKIRKDIIEQ